jgi:signal transduction histidine kinase/ActR/RegA family two-component response regulator
MMMPQTQVTDTNQAARSVALQRAALFGAPAEESFDRLTRLAKMLLNASAAAVSVPMEDDLFLKSGAGFPESFGTTCTLPTAGRSPCHEVVRTGQPVVIEDANALPPDSPIALSQVGYRAYAGIPLINLGGVVLASFCVLETEPRAWTEAEIAILRDLAATAMTEIELRSLVSEQDRTQALLAGQKRILEMIAKGAPLKEELAAVAGLIDRQADGVQCSILLLEGETLLRGAAPNLPEAFNCSIHQIPIFPAIGPCGLAAHSRKQVISVDLDKDEHWTPEFRALAREHGLRSCWSTPIPGTDGSVLGTFAMYYSEPREPGPVEQQLIDVATHLAGIAIERARSEQSLRQRAEELVLADRRKDEFLAMLAHELRNPLAAIRIALQLQQRQGEQRPGSRMAEIVKRQVQHLARLADDLLDVSRITRGKIELRRERLDLKQLVEEVVEDYRADIDNHGLTLDLDLLDAPVYIDGDRTRLAQVIGNILHNAVKFTDPDGHISMRLTHEDSGAAIIIEDTGIGMSPEVLQQVFQPFAQIEQTLARSQGGLGLGLALVANLVKMHGGEVTADSEGAGCGSRFTIRLPLQVAPAADDRAADSEGAEDTNRLRVLIIEDNQDTALALQELFAMDGHEVRVAYTGPAGIKEATAFRPQAVVCDLGLPGMDGYAVASALRDHPATVSARLIAFSGYGQSEDRRRSRECGFDLHLTKAADPAELQRAVAAVAHEAPAA